MQPQLSRFCDPSVAERYQLRPSYPPETFAILHGLIADQPAKVLDIGCGTGVIARNIATGRRPCGRCRLFPPHD